MPTKNKDSGFTIIELLIASLIIAVGILGWSKTQTGSMKSRAISNDITTASELAIAKVEELSLECQNNGREDLDGSNTVSIQGISFLQQWTVSKNTVAQASFWTIDILVTWQHYEPTSLRYRRVVTGK